MSAQSICGSFKMSGNNYCTLLQVCIFIAISFLAIVPFNEAQGFHITLGERLLKSISNPQVVLSNPLIKPLECKNLNNQSESGICMFSIDCMQSKGVPLSVCKHNYFVGTCCKLPNTSELVNQVTRELPPKQSTSQLPVTTTRQDFTLHSSAFSIRSTSLPPTQSSPSATESLTSSSGSSSSSSSSSGVKSTEERYMISSVSLFPTSQKPTTADVPQPAPTGSGESARNVEGLVYNISQEEDKNKLVVSSDTLASQLQNVSTFNSFIQTTNSDIKQKKNEYEVVKEDNDLPTTLNSAHSPSSSQQQFNMIEHIYTKADGEKEHPSNERNNVYLVDDLQKRQQNVVFANNHQQLHNVYKSPQSVSNGTLEEQQSTRQKLQDEHKVVPTTTSLNLPSTIQTSPFPSSSSSSSSSPSSSSSSSPVIRSSLTPHLDLVSTNDATQTTTPFTTSLSTAILPNITSHPYTPTDQPNTSMLVSSSHSSTSASSSKKPLAQLYNSHTPEMDTQNPGRPLFGPGSLMASTKLVGSSSSSNQFIPGLAGLQSALLSHIPFKLATGLTSYLQAAMKPVGGRPLISSNTAPALQYQQNTANANKSSSPLSNNVKFPGSSSSQTAPMVSSFSESTPPMLQQPHVTGNSLIISSTSKLANSSSNIHYDVIRETQLVCGKPQVVSGDNRKRVGRIVGGNQSMFGQWPWMVSLRQWRKGAFLHKCGAALLNEKWAITAAHCVESVKASDLLLRLGEFDVSNQEEPYPYIERRVKTVVAHPSFDPKTFEYDLALLKFAEPVKYERNIVPVCVPSGNDSYVDRMATVIGWGRLYEDGPLPDVIQHVDVPIITNKECEKMYKNAGYIEEIPEMFICAGISKGGRDSCEGDSGGPLTMVDHDGRSYLVGIISWGIGCALPSQPGVYTRITAFSGWINQIIDF